MASPTNHLYSAILGAVSGAFTGGATAATGSATAHAAVVGIVSAAALALSHEGLYAVTRFRTELAAAQHEIAAAEDHLPAVVRGPGEALTVAAEDAVTADATARVAKIRTELAALEASVEKKA